MKRVFHLICAVLLGSAAIAQTATVDGYFNNLGKYSADAKVWSVHTNTDGTLTVIYDGTSVAGVPTYGAFILDGEELLTGTAPEGSRVIFELGGERYTAGYGGVFDSQGQNVLSIEDGSSIQDVYVDSAHGQALLLQRWDSGDASAFFWNGIESLTQATIEYVAENLSGYTSHVPLDSNFLFLCSSNGIESLRKIDLENHIEVERISNDSVTEYFPFPDVAARIEDACVFHGMPTVAGFIPDFGNGVAQYNGHTWIHDIYGDLIDVGKVYVDPQGEHIYVGSDQSEDHEGNPLSGLYFSDDLNHWKPVTDKRGAQLYDGSRSYLVWTKGTMWVLAEDQNSASLFKDISETNLPENRVDIYVLKSTYTPYVSIDEVNRPSLVLHPNPASDNFSYNINVPGLLVNSAGSIVKTIDANELNVTVSDIPSGIYFLKTPEGNGTIAVAH